MEALKKIEKLPPDIKGQTTKGDEFISLSKETETAKAECVALLLCTSSNIYRNYTESGY